MPVQSMSMANLLQLLISTTGWGQAQKMGLDNKCIRKSQNDLNCHFEIYCRPILVQSNHQFANEAVLGPLDQSLFCPISALTAPKVYNDRQKTGECSLHMHSENVPLTGFLGCHSSSTCVNIKHQWQLCTDPVVRCVSHCTGRLFWPNHSTVQLQRTPSKCVVNQAGLLQSLCWDKLLVSHAVA